MTLPGGDLPYDGLGALARDLAAACPAVGPATAERLARTYGTMARDVFAGAVRAQDLGRHFGAGLFEREVAHLIENEWATTADDILWRRTKTGPRLGDAERSCLAEWLSGRTRPTLALGR